MTEVANKKYDDYKTYTVTVTRNGPNQGPRVFTKVSAPSRFCAMDVVIDFGNYDPTDITRRYRFEVSLDGEFDTPMAS